ESAEDAAEHVDLVDEAVALTGAHRVVDRVVLATHVDATGRADTGAELAADALLHPVGVAVEHVAAGIALRLLLLLLGIPSGHPRFEHLPERDPEALDVDTEYLEEILLFAHISTSRPWQTEFANRHHQRGQDQPDQRGGNESLPAECHQLVV